MATITVNPAAVKHTLPAAFYGFNFARFNHQDAIAASWQAAMNTIKPEILRAHMWGADYAYVGHTNCQNGFSALNPKPKVSVQGDAFPNAIPSTLSPVTATNRSTSSSKNPAGASQLVQDYIDAGLDVLWYEPYNEPTNCFDTTGNFNSGNEWYSTQSGYGVGAGDQGVRRHAEAWAVVHGRFWNDQVLADHPTIRRLWMSWGSSGNSSFNEQSIIDYLDGTPLPNGQTNPNGTPSNMTHFEVLNIHAYGGSGSDDQGNVNAMVFPTFSDGQGSFYGMWSKMRSLLDARGGTSHTIAYNEGPSLPDNNAQGAFYDIELGIVTAIYQAKFKIEHALLHSCNRGIVGSEGHAIFDPNATPSTATMNTRALVARDMVSPFMRLYKKQLIGGASAANPPAEITGAGNTPASSSNNSVKRIWCAAGLNAAGDKIAFLLANIDKTNSESVTLQFGATASGNATYKQHDASVAGNKTAPSSGTFPTNGNTSHTFTVAAGDAFFIEVPIAAGGDVTPPSLTAATVNGDSILLDYDESLDGTSTPQPGDYAVLVNAVARTVSSVQIAAGGVQIELATSVDPGDTVTISYTRATGREVKDAAGNLSANFSGQEVTNNTQPVLRLPLPRVAGTRATNPSGRVQGLGGGGL